MSDGSRLSGIFLNCKKKLPLMLVLLIVGVVLLVASNLFVNEGNQMQTGNDLENEKFPETSSQHSTVVSAEIVLEKRLETVLSQIDKVGKVSVTLTLETGPEYQYATNISTNERRIEETDTSGGNRVTTEVTNDDEFVTVQSASMGGQDTVLIKELRPEIEGVLVVAEGASDIEVKAKLSRAVQTVLGVPAHSVSVLPMKNEG